MFIIIINNVKKSKTEMTASVQGNKFNYLCLLIYY